ncbi:MAG TPA: hypothetical protein VF937_02540 [Chloroflexota bacterium]
MPEEPALAETLLAADPDQRQQLLSEAAPHALATALSELGHRRDVAAAEILALVDQVVQDRALRKAARRELHRLRSVGVELPRPAPIAPAPEPTVAQPASLAVSEAWATDIDPGGSRALWLVGDRPLGGVWFAALLLNDQRGLQDLNIVETTRKRFHKDFEESRRGQGTWVRLSGEYALRLVREGVDLTREVGGGLAPRYRVFRDVFGEAPGPPERALVYETISPVEINFNPGWLEDSTRLLAEPEVAGWYISVPADFQARALEVARAPSAGLLVPGHTPEQQAAQLIADAARESVTPPVRRGLRRRLEETAYVFVATERLAAGRLAAAAAHALEGNQGPPVERQPLPRMLIAAGLARLTGAETVGSRRAAEVLLELVERAGQREAEGGPVETRPSGLILPR